MLCRARSFSTPATLLLTLFAATGYAPAQTNQVARGPVYVIPIKGMIERALVYVVRRGVSQAVQNNAAVIILDMDTPGGRLDACAEIMQLLAALNGQFHKTMIMVTHDPELANRAHRQIHLLDGRQIDLQQDEPVPLAAGRRIAAGE